MFEKITIEDWILNFYTEVERLFNGRLPRTFNIDLIQPDLRMKPESAARDYFVAYNL